MVTAWLFMDMNSPEFRTKKLALRSALRTALGNKSVSVESVVAGSVKMQLHMSVDAMLLMYRYAIHVPGFLAGLGIIRFNALGRYISVVVVQPSPVTGAPTEDIEQTGDIPICRKSKFKSHYGDFQLHTGKA